MPERVVDYSPLTDPVAQTDVVAWRAQVRASGAQYSTLNSSLVATYVSAAAIGVFALFVFGGLIATVFANGIQNATAAGLVVPLVFVVGFVFAAVTILRRQLRGGGRWVRWYRLARFAQINGMLFAPLAANPNYPGEIFGIGRNRTAIDHLDTNTGRFMDMGNYRWITGSGKNQQTHTWGFLALRLDREMPNIVLDSRANNSIFGSNLPATLDGSQVLHLEGDFDRYFTLYCPKEYEQDALYIFTPDLMALLIDEAAPFDVELVDSWTFLYSSTPFDMNNPAVLQRLFGIADTVGAKTLSQTDHYADARIGDFSADVVAPQGARLKRGVPILGIVIIAAFVVFFGWQFLAPFFAALTGHG